MILLEDNVAWKCKPSLFHPKRSLRDLRFCVGWATNLWLADKPCPRSDVISSQDDPTWEEKDGGEVFTKVFISTTRIRGPTGARGRKNDFPPRHAGANVPGAPVQGNTLSGKPRQAEAQGQPTARRSEATSLLTPPSASRLLLMTKGRAASFIGSRHRLDGSARNSRSSASWDNRRDDKFV